MSFTHVKNNARSRFNENQVFLSYITSLEPTNPSDVVPTEVNIMKGLFYVHLYASLEKSVNELIENTLVHISSKSVQYQHFNNPFYSISLVNKLKSFKDTGYNNFFNKASEIFNELSSSDACNLQETTFSKSLQNIWINTIKEICNSFGISTFSVTANIKATVDEIVDKRNAVAHGRETAKAIGERFRTIEIRKKMELIIEFCNYLIDLFEEFYLQKNYLKPTAKSLYP